MEEALRCENLATVVAEVKDLDITESRRLQLAREQDFYTSILQYKQYFGNSLYIAATRSYTGMDSKKLFRVHQLSRRLNIPRVACNCNDIHYHNPARRQLQDILTCIREKCTIHTAGCRLERNAERYMKPMECHRLFRQYPEAIDNALAIAPKEALHLYFLLPILK